MNNRIFALAFLLGAIAVVWVGVGFIGSNTLALAMTLIIGTVYVAGTAEMIEFRRATSTLDAALAALPNGLGSLGDWLATVHPSLRNLVRLRIEGERIALPGPALTPYLLALLVMLGMLGTFLGMVVTLNGAVFALEGTADLRAIQSALAAPIKGLGLAFGTSVAGVAASAMLGLISALSRRERMLTAQFLDTKVATELRGFSLVHQRHETLKALQIQAHALPDMFDRWQAMIQQMERREQQLNERMLSNQERFYLEVEAAYRNLACSLEKSFKDSLTESARATGENVKPAVEAALTGLAREAKLIHREMIVSTQRQLEGLTAHVTDVTNGVTQAWTAALAKHQGTSEDLVRDLDRSLATFNAIFEQRSGSLLVSVGEALSALLANQASGDRQRLAEWTQSLESMMASLQREWQEAGAHTSSQQQRICSTLDKVARDIIEHSRVHAGKTLDETVRLLNCAEDLVRSRIAADADWTVQHRQHADQLAELWRAELGALRDQEALRGDAAVERLGDLQAALTSHLTTLGAALEDPMARLLEAASEAPRAAAEVIKQLRQEMTDSVARDKELLEEGRQIMETLHSLLTAITQASNDQREAIHTLVTSSSVLLSSVRSQFSDQVDAECSRLSDIAAQVSSSAVEVSSLGEAFGFAVQLFSDANEKLIASLMRIEASMGKSTARSDEQLAYYVAQAREIIDLSIMSQKEIIDDLRLLAARPENTADQVGE